MINKIDIKDLSGKCLISSPYIDDEFSGSVIYICSHGIDGAMGFIINKRIKEFSFKDLAIELPTGFGDFSASINLYQGGPMEIAKGFVLHSSEYHITDSLNTGGGITVSSSLEVLQDILLGNGPKQKIIALGYSGWAPNQLEKEIANNRWLITDATPELVLGSDDNNKFSQALSLVVIKF